MAHSKAKNKNKQASNNETEHRRQEVQQAIKSACDQLRDDGVDPRDYVEQLAWLFFLKAFDEMESRREEEAAFDGSPYRRRLDGEYRWSSWSSMSNRPDQMLEFVDGKLWPHLRAFGETEDTRQFANDPIAERFRRIFWTVRNHSRRGASFARVTQQVNRLHFGDATDVIVLSELYEGLLKDVAADSAGYAGEFYTQRHIIQAMINVVRPKIGDRIYDPCFGTAGFLAESAEYIRNMEGTLSGSHLDQLQQKTFYGIELKPLTYLLGTMNMLLHRIEGANIELGNTLELHSTNVPENDRYDVILSNPPYGGKMARELQTNFTIQSGSTEILFLQHIMANLATGGRAAVIIPEGVLFRGGPDAKIRERLLREFDVHTVLSLPVGCFLPYTSVKTNIIFFNRCKDHLGTKDVWFYELTNDGFDLKSTRRPIQGSQIPDFRAKWEERLEGDNSWIVSISEIAQRDWDLSARNPNKEKELEYKPPLELVQSIKAKEKRVIELLGELEEFLENLRNFWRSPMPESPRIPLGSIAPKADAPIPASDAMVWNLSLDDVETGTGTIRERKHCLVSELGSTKCSFDTRHVLYSKLRPYLNKVVVPDQPGVGTSELIPLLPDPERLDRSFLAYYLRSPEFVDFAVAHSRGANLPRVAMRALWTHRVPVPSLDEQRRIVERIEMCMKRVRDIQALRGPLEEMASLTASILRSTFSGSL